MTDWIDNIVKKRDLNEQEAERESKLISMAVSQAMPMTVRLINQMRSDTEEFSKRIGYTITFKSVNRGIEIRHDGIPKISLRLVIPQTGETQITVSQSARPTSASFGDKTTKYVDIICRSQDFYFYRLEGGDIVSESQVSESLLRPLFTLFS